MNILATKQEGYGKVLLEGMVAGAVPAEFLYVPTAQVLEVAALTRDDRLGRVGGVQRLVLLDDQPAGVAAVAEHVDDTVDPGVALAERAEHAAAQRLLEALVLALYVVHHGGPAILDVDVANQLPIVPRRLRRVGAAESEVAGVQAQADQ